MKNRPLSVLALAALAASAAQAQPARPPADSLVTLSPFEVAAHAPEGYVASESLSGTRIRAEIKDLPFHVSVITKEFFQDFDKQDLADALAFTSSATSNDITPSAVNLRGFSGSQTRNGLSFFGLLTRSSLDRVEVIKGPYAAIYGKTQPGGLINLITKRPSPRAVQELSLTAGTLDYFRAELSLSGPLAGDGRLLYRLDLGHNEKGGTQDFAKSFRSEYSAALSYRFSERTYAQVEASKMDNYASRQSPLVWLRDPVTNQYVGKLTGQFDFNRSGPSGKDRVHQDWTYEDVQAYVDHRFGDVLSVRVSGIWWNRNSPALAMGGNTFVPTNSRTLTALNLSLSDIARDNLQLIADALAQYRTGAIAHKTLLTLTRSRESESTWTRGLGAATLANPALFNRTLSLDAPTWHYPRFSDLSTNGYSVLSRDRTQVTTTEAAFVSHRAELFESRLKLFVGGRHDTVTNDLRDRLTGLREKTTARAFTPQLGANYALTRRVSLYANYSESYQPQSQVRSTTQELYPNENGIGVEAGLKAALLDGRLNFTLGAYAIERNNVLQSYFDERLGFSVTDVDGQIKTDGVELDVNWQASPSLQFIGGFGAMDNRITRNRESPWVVGQLVARGPSPWNYGLAAIYRFRHGALQGLVLRADTSGRGKALGENGGGPYTRNGVTYANDGRINVLQPRYAILNLGASYGWRGGGRFRHSVALNLKNVFDERYTFGNWIPADGFATSVTYTLKR